MTVVFVVLRVLPGDPVLNLGGALFTQADIEAKRQELGLSDPLPVQYVSFLGQMVTGNFGRSLRTSRLVLDELSSRMPATLKLAGTSLLIAVAIGLPTGVLAATRRDSVLARVSMSLSLLGLSLPSFWLGFLFILAFAVWLRLLPSGGAGTLLHLVLPACTLAFAVTAVIARISRASMLEVLGADYIRTARGKGLQDVTVITKHALRNALIPTVTIVGLQFGALLAGAVIVETVFAWPGIGRLLIESVRFRDFPMVQAITLFLACGFVLVNLTVDLLYGWLDPRITYR